MTTFLYHDYLIVGSGLYGVSCARFLTDKGYSCLVIDKNSYLGGVCHTEDYGGLTIHKNGIHIFHTSNKNIWDFVNKYSTFQNYQLNVCATNGSDVYSMPFNMHTFSKLLGLNTPDEVYQYLETQKINNPKNLEELAINFVGETVYKTLIKGYTEKLWGKKCSELPASIIKRLPIRYSFDDNYFDDTYLGICDYSKLAKNILDGVNDNGDYISAPIDYILNEDFLLRKEYWLNQAQNIIYCGSVDELLDYELGEMQWRSLEWKDVQYEYNGHNGLGSALLNNTNAEVPYTRSIDHIYVNPNKIKTYTGSSIISYETPIKWSRGKDRYYPNGSEELYEKYVKLLKEKYPQILLGGRVGLYKYMDMDDTIQAAMDFCNTVYNRIQPSIDKFCTIWVTGTNPKDIPYKSFNSLVLSFITTTKPIQQNINNMNRFLCEFVTMWYVWKNNLHSDYVAFCHYRRKINPSDILYPELSRGAIQFFHRIIIIPGQNKYIDTNSDWPFLAGKKDIYPDFVIDDIIEYLLTLTVIPQEDIQRYFKNQKYTYCEFFNREIFACSWKIFCNLVSFINGYIEFISSKYNLNSYDDWKNHIYNKVLGFFIKFGKDRVDKWPEYSAELHYQSKENYLKIFNDDGGLSLFCNTWRIYAYTIEDLIGVYIATHKHVCKIESIKP